MAIILKVNWIELSDKPDPYQRVARVGGEAGEFQWCHSVAEAIRSLEDDAFHYYVEKDDRPLRLEIGIAPGGRKYLKTEGDKDRPEFLLTLPENSRRARD